MASSITSSNAKILEVPVTLQGAQTVEGAERRELFTETTKTTLVYEKGAVVNLKSRVTQGQCVFLRNELTGREMLCKVLELRQTGEVNSADLEFTGYAPDFWEKPHEKAAAAAPRNEVQEKIDRAVQELAGTTDPKTPPAADTTPTATATPSANDVSAADPTLSLMQTSDPIATASPRSTVEEELSAQAPKEILASLQDPAPANLPPTPDATPAFAEPPAHASEAEPDDEKDSAQLAALIALDDRKRAKKEAAAKTKGESDASAPEAASPQTDGSAVANPEGQPNSHAAAAPLSGAPAKVASPASIAIALWKQRLSSRKAQIGVGIAASLLIAGTIGIAWRAKHAAAAHASALSGSNLPAAAWAGAKQPSAQPPGAANEQPALTPGAGGAASGASATSAARESTGDSKGVATGPARMEGRVTATVKPVARLADSSAAPRAEANKSLRRQKESEPITGDIIPPQIVSQPQPTFPSWANDIDMDSEVLLEASIDEKGQITHTRVLSGPRALQREAQKAVALWIFEPALENGKPVATHMVLTVEFQR